MSENKESSQITISLPEFHRKKLKAMMTKLGVNRSGIIQRLIESQSIFTLGNTKNKENGN